jgi:hypothetical protein
MKSRQILAQTAALLLLVACNRGLPPALEKDISLEADRLQESEHQVQKSETALDHDLSQSPDLFRGVAEVAVWRASLGQSKSELQAARDDSRRLADLVKRNRPDVRISGLLEDERKRRQSALQKSQSVDKAVAQWLDYQHDPAAFVGRMKQQRELIRTFDWGPVKQSVQRAEGDWPNKKPALESRLSSLEASAKLEQGSTETTPAVLIAEENTLSQQAEVLASRARNLQDECGQLYDSWDRILTDLDRSQAGQDVAYRERLKTVRTHLIDVPAKKSETHSDERWSNISEREFHAVENDIGMSLAHKDAGLFDSEAQQTPQPPGFSYVASPAAGSNQYGYWSHSGGQSIWTFLPEYLILRELLWNHDYHPVMAGEYNAYRAAQTRGTTYYGRETPNAAPKYGTHGTFTQSSYADSRYVQSGGFKGSAYASSRSGGDNGFFNRLRQQPPSGVGNESEGGRRFGRSPGGRPAGRAFGRRR